MWKALGLFKPYAGAQLWCQAGIASSLTTPHLSAERPNYSSTFNCTRHKELPVAKLCFLHLLPPRAARCFCHCPASLLWLEAAGVEDLILLILFNTKGQRNGHWVLPSQHCPWQAARLGRTELPHRAEPLPDTEHRRCCWGTTSGSADPKWIPLAHSETTTQCNVL